MCSTGWLSSSSQAALGKQRSVWRLPYQLVRVSRALVASELATAATKGLQHTCARAHTHTCAHHVSLATRVSHNR
jgi:hypothetical protein